MGRFDRYVLSQALVLFGFFSLVLILIYWINQAVRLFDTLIGEGQSARVFFEITALTLPGVIKIVLPLAAFVAALYVTNRLSADSELTVVQATGYSGFRLARAMLFFGLFVSALMMILTHVLVPIAGAAYEGRRNEINQNITARFLTEGRFMYPADGVTLYIGAISPAGELQNLFLSDTRDPEEEVTYTAELAYLVKTEAGPQLVMRSGMAQTKNRADQTLIKTTFADFAFNIGALIEAGGPRGRRLRQVPSNELWAPSPALLAETGVSAETARLELHVRNGEALLALSAALLGFSALIVGGFSRFGVWRQVMAAIGLAILIKFIETWAINLARARPDLWALPYVNIAIGLLISAFLLYWSGHPYLFRRRPSILSGAA